MSNSGRGRRQGRNRGSMLSQPTRFDGGNSIVQRVLDDEEQHRDDAIARNKARKKVTLPKFNLPPMEDDNE